jgi:hypothetical protein
MDLTTESGPDYVTPTEEEVQLSWQLLILLLVLLKFSTLTSPLPHWNFSFKLPVILLPRMHFFEGRWKPCNMIVLLLNHKTFPSLSSNAIPALSFGLVADMGPSLLVEVGTGLTSEFVMFVAHNWQDSVPRSHPAGIQPLWACVWRNPPIVHYS